MAAKEKSPEPSKEKLESGSSISNTIIATVPDKDKEDPNDSGSKTNSQTKEKLAKDNISNDTEKKQVGTSKESKVKDSKAVVKDNKEKTPPQQVKLKKEENAETETTDNRRKTRSTTSGKDIIDFDEFKYENHNITTGS